MLKIRLKKLGRRHLNFYECVVTESTQRRDGRFIEKLGTYNPNQKEDGSKFNLKCDSLIAWVKKGAVLSEGVIEGIKGNHTDLYQQIHALKTAQQDKLRAERKERRMRHKAQLASKKGALPLGVIEKEKRVAVTKSKKKRLARSKAKRAAAPTRRVNKKAAKQA